MDESKLALDASPAASSASTENMEFEDVPLFDAVDLQGVNAEAVGEDETKEGVQNENVRGNLESNDSMDNNDEDSVIVLDGSDTASCREHDSGIRSSLQPVEGICGHLKCQEWLMASGQAPKQCQLVSAPEMKQNDAEFGRKEVEKIDSDEDSDDDIQIVEERTIVKPNDYVFELQVDGKKSLAVVSTETLRELGIRTPYDADPGNHQTEVAGSDVRPGISPQSSTSVSEHRVNDSQNLHVDSGRSIKSMKNVKKIYTDHIIPVKTETDENDGPKRWKCLLCDEDLSLPYHQEYHIYCNPENGRRPFICGDCPKEFVNRSHYDDHVQSEHTREKLHECPVCSQKFMQESTLNQHLVQHTKKSDAKEVVIYMCAHCRQQFPTKGSCRRHINLHTDPNAFSCNECKQPFKTEGELNAHQITHLEQRPVSPVKCPDCTSIFFTAKDLKRHRLCHTGETPYQCSFRNCEANFQSKDRLKHHIREAHKLSDKMAKIMGDGAAKKYKQIQSSSKKSSGKK